MNQKTKLTKQEENELANVMSTLDGRALIERILYKETQIQNSTYTGNAGTYYNLGRQDVGRDIHNDIMALCPDLFMKMIKESETKRITEERNARSK